jgi:hypothetical protein
MRKEESTGKVVGVWQRSWYRPDLGALARHQIASAREKLGLSHAQFADILESLLGWQPSPEVVESWETIATPPGDVVLAAGLAAQSVPRDIVAVALSKGAERVVELLSAVIGDLERITGSPDVVRTFSMRGLITRPEWNGIIRGSHTHIWLYGMAEMGYASDDEVPSILRVAASKGCDIRVLLLDPTYTGITDIDQDEGNPPGTLSVRVRAALARFERMRAACDGHMHIRLFSSAPNLSIVRGDNRMFVTPYMRFFIGSNSPTFDLKDSGGSLFDRYTRHFENVWKLAGEWIV